MSHHDAGLLHGEYRPLTASLLEKREQRAAVLEAARASPREDPRRADPVPGYKDHGFNAKSPRPVPQLWWCDPMHDPPDKAEATAKSRFPPAAARARHDEAEEKRRQDSAEWAGDARR